MSYDNPENQRTLSAINNGCVLNPAPFCLFADSCMVRNAPPSVLNVQVNQPVELRVARRMDEAYVAPPKVTRPFGGTGHRLGSPIPGESSSPSGASASNLVSSIPGAFPSNSGGSRPATTFGDSSVQGLNPRFEVDQTQPTTSVQIRLADGTRCVCNFDTKSCILRAHG
jgi:UBX domain-containing protein 1